MLCVFFFFQAEDGIRDIGVTGVQTCALPILDIACLNQVCCRFDSCQRYSRRWSYGALWGLISPHVPGSNPGSATNASVRSEERRVGKECRSRWSPYH